MLAAALFAVVPVVVPQDPPVRGQQLVEVTRAGPNQFVSNMRSTQNGLCPTRSGGLFVVLARTTLSAPIGAPGASSVGSDLELWRSDDGGKWVLATSMPTRNDGDAAIVPDGDLLACAWTAGEGKTFGSVYFQRYDPKAKEWLGQPELLVGGVSPVDQYYCSDMARASDGSLVVAVGNNSTAQAPVWNCSWSTGMRWLPQGKGEWRLLVQVNKHPYGCCASLAANGDTVDITYRCNPNESIHGLRTFDCRGGAFLQSPEDNAAIEPGERFVANVGVLCMDAGGSRTLLHVVGDKEPGRGELAVSFAGGRNKPRTTRIAEDPPLQAGNENPVHFTLARGPANQVFAYFSKLDEKFAKLWQCVVEDGQPIAAAKVVAEGDENAFQQLCGMRVSEVFCGMHVATLGRTAKVPGGVVSVFGTWPARAIWSKARKG
ncbi:MAG: hypothetical protein JNK15_02080 [Planctomycetes bacterium]|nr:hypothetical protein [Planctomycetota bacterium]